MSLSTSFLAVLGNAKRIQIRMMAARGHAVSAEERALVALEPLAVAAHFIKAAVAARVSLAEAMSAVYPPDTTTPPPQGTAPPVTAVVYLDRLFDDAKRREKMGSSAQIKDALSKLKEADIQAAIVVSPTRLSPDARREILEARVVVGRSAAGIHMQVLSLHDHLSLCVVDHMHVPPHRALSADEAAAFLSACKVHKASLPVMRDSDAVAMFYGYRAGQVICIDRPTEVAYRVVTHDTA